MSDDQAPTGPPETVRERPVLVQCQWCGESLLCAPRGPAPRYCPRPKTCRQRAYEVRTAQARADADPVDGGRSTEPIRQVIERVVQPRHPSTAAAWIEALQALTGQLQRGPLKHTYHRHAELAAALRAALDAVPVLPERTRTTMTVPDDDETESLWRVVPAAGPPAAPPLPVAVGPVWQALALLPGRAVSVTLERLADAAGTSVAAAAATLAAFVEAGKVSVQRGGDPVADVTALPAHARFTVTANGT